MTGEKNPMKIGYVVKMFPRLSETFILNEILELERRGVEVTIFSAKKPNEGRFHPQLSELKASVLYLEDLETKRWPVWMAREWSQLGNCRDNLLGLIDNALAKGDSASVDYIWWAGWIASKVKKLGLSHLHAHFASLPSTLAYFANRVCSVPFSFTAHAKDIFVYDMDEHHLRDKLQAANFVVTVTHFNQRYLLSEAPETDPDRIRVIHNGINVDQFNSNEGIKRKRNQILTVGRLVIKKGFGDLLDACALLKKDNVPFSCLIVGQGPEESNLKQKCAELGLNDEIEFAGAKNLDEVRSLMQTSTLFCLPCTVAPDGNQDALPTVLLEALASGLPIVSTTVSGIPEIVDHEVDGLLVEADRPDLLAVHMKRLLTSAELRDRFAEAGRQKAEAKFDLRKNAGETLLDALRSSAEENGVSKTGRNAARIGVFDGKS